MTKYVAAVINLVFVSFLFLIIKIFEIQDNDGLANKNRGIKYIYFWST